MLYYDKKDLSKEIDPAKSNSSKKCMVLSIGIVCHDLTILYLNISDIATITVKIHGIAKSDTIRLLENSVFDDRGYI